MSVRDKLLNMIDTAYQLNKVLDVSKFSADGKGARVISAPKSDRSAKKQIGDLNIVSDNYDSYKLAIDILGPEYHVFLESYLDNFGDRSRSSPRTRSPARSRSPPRFDIRSNIRNY